MTAPIEIAGQGLAARVNAEDTICFTTFGGARDNEGLRRTARSWRHFVGGLRQILDSTAPSKTDLFAIGPFELGDGATRSDAAVQAVTLVALDVDGLPASELPGLLDRLQPFAAVVHTSPSDGGSEASTRKLRVYAEPSRPIAPYECRAVRLGFAQRLRVTVDRVTLNPSRVYFAGRITGTPERELWAFGRAPVDVDELIASVPEEISPQPPTGGASPPIESVDVREIASACPIGRALLGRKAIVSVRRLDRSQGRSMGLVITCPNAKNHDTHGARDTDRTALYLPPSRGGALGAICCVRTACAGIRHWLPYFDDHELTDAGIILCRVRNVFAPNRDAKGRSRCALNLDGFDLKPRYLRVSEGTGVRAALLDALHTDEIDTHVVGRWIGITEDAPGRIDRIYVVEAAP